MSKAAADAVYDALVNNYGNPSSLHSKGLEAQHYVDAARRAAADSIGVSEREIFFTSEKFFCILLQQFRKIKEAHT